MNIDVKGEVFVLCSILYQSQEYIVTNIQPYSFKYNDRLISLTFSEGSQLRSIEWIRFKLKLGRKAFSFSSIKSLTIPSTFDLEEGWCAYTDNLNYVLLSPDYKRYK